MCVNVIFIIWNVRGGDVWTVAYLIIALCASKCANGRARLRQIAAELGSSCCPNE